jgi:hypothetical protein
MSLSLKYIVARDIASSPVAQPNDKIFFKLCFFSQGSVAGQHCTHQDTCSWQTRGSVGFDFVRLLSPHLWQVLADDHEAAAVADITSDLLKQESKPAAQLFLDASILITSSYYVT